MKRTGKTLSLSGQLPKRTFLQTLFRDPTTILEYANVLDLTRAWKVKDFKCWIQETGLEFGTVSAPNSFGIDVQLSTDDIPGSAQWNNAGDNRGVGWGTLSYNLSDGQYKPQTFSGVSRMLIHSEYWMQPDHLIQNKLTLSAQCSGTNSALEAMDGYTLNYIVYLEEYDITPVESIMFGIKGIAQNSTN